MLSTHKLAALHESIHSTLGIDIRAGLHTGEIELRGDDVTGMAVNIAARVMGLANANETLVSRTVTDLVAGSGLEFFVSPCAPGRASLR